MTWARKQTEAPNVYRVASELARYVRVRDQRVTDRNLPCLVQLVSMHANRSGWAEAHVTQISLHVHDHGHDRNGRLYALVSFGSRSSAPSNDADRE